ncbi:TPA: hypothetical protein P1K35_000674 [Providencia rettgeri]|uniref:hypothetical protein n=1 Tax=Providencia sp. PROV129 TaxID=2949839 RepID=UPI00234B88BA
MTKINKNVPYSTENLPTIDSKTSNQNSFIRFASRINNVLESFWHLFKPSIKNKKCELNIENNIAFIEKYFSISSKYKKEIIHDETSTSIILRKKIERFKPNKDDCCTSIHLGHFHECEGFTFDRDLSDKFNKDFNRMNVYLHTPYRQENSVKIKDARVLSAKFGLKNAQLISQIAHQGFLADPTFFLHQINKNEHYNIGRKAIQNSKDNNSTEDMRTTFIIKETKNGDCIIAANKNFEYINTSDDFGSALPGLSMSIERKTYLTKSNEGILKLKNHSGISKLINDNKDEIKITIKKT